MQESGGAIKKEGNPAIAETPITAGMPAIARSSAKAARLLGTVESLRTKEFTKKNRENSKKNRKGAKS
jgi:hypothetical protein